MDIPEMLQPNKKKINTEIFDDDKKDSILFNIILGISVVFILLLFLMPIIDGISIDKKAEKSFGLFFGHDYYTLKEVESVNDNYIVNSAIKTSIVVHLFSFIFLLVLFYLIAWKIIEEIKKPLELGWEHYTLAILFSIIFMLLGQFIFNWIMLGHISYPVVGFNRILEAF